VIFELLTEQEEILSWKLLGKRFGLGIMVRLEYPPERKAKDRKGLRGLAEWLKWEFYLLRQDETSTLKKAAPDFIAGDHRSP
jgi:hypothetical protein